MTFGDLKQKDVINLQNGQLLGRVSDLDLSDSGGQVTALIIPGGFSFAGMLRGERCSLVIPWQQIQRIGEDVILVCIDESCCTACR